MSRTSYHFMGYNNHATHGSQFFQRFRSSFSHAGQLMLTYICFKPIKFAQKWFQHPKAHPTQVILCGLRGCGKTAILYRLKLGIFIHTIPSATKISEKFDFQFGFSTSIISLYVHDLRPEDFHLASNRKIVKETQKIIYVLDSTDKMKFKEAADQIQSLIYHNNFIESGGKMLIFCNKQDSIRSFPITEILQFLDLPANFESSLLVLPCSALSGSGIEEGFDWLLDSYVLPNQPQPSVYSPLLMNRNSQIIPHFPSDPVFMTTL